MTKQQLLEMIESSTLKHETDDSLYKQYYSLIEATLRFCPNNMKLDGLSSLSHFRNRDDFEMFIRINSTDNIKNVFEAILTDLNTLANRYVVDNPEEIRKKATALSVGNNWLRENHEKNHRIIFPVFIALFIAFSLAVVVFALLEEFNVINWGGHVSAVSGILDFLNGVAFFIYEQINDRHHKKEQDELCKITGENVAVKNSNNVIIAKGSSNVHIGDSYVMVNKGSVPENEIRAFIIKNSNNYIKAKNSKDIYIGDK